MSDLKRRGNNVVVAPGDPPAYRPESGDEGAKEVRAVAFMACENLHGSDNWAWLCPLILALSASVSLIWLWYTDELVPERKGYVFIGLVFTAYAVMNLSKRVRDEQHADLLIKYGSQTRFYHESTVQQLRGTDAFRTLTRVGFILAVVALFGGIWFMPFSPASKWMIAMMCVQTISSAFTYANHKRNQDTADNFIRTLHHA